MDPQEMPKATSRIKFHLRKMQIRAAYRLRAFYGDFKRTWVESACAYTILGVEAVRSSGDSAEARSKRDDAPPRTNGD